MFFGILRLTLIDYLHVLALHRRCISPMLRAGNLEDVLSL
jgi:hypothetical protein